MQDRRHDRRRHHHHHRDANDLGRPKTLEPLQPGQVIFRMLCHVNTAGGVIGSSGSIVKRLECDTGAKIKVEPTIPSCLERVINVIGTAAIERKVALEGDKDSAEECEDVSQAQDALFRVFERVLEVEGASDGVIGCRLLAGTGQIGPFMGRGGSIVDKIRKNTGTKIRVLPADQLPACASQSDELIQIMGGVLAVKKALLAVSCRLQLHPPIERVPVDVPSYALFPNSHSEFSPHHSSLSPPLPSSSVDYAIDHLLADVDRIFSLDEENTKLEVVFRLLCSTIAVGGVIGKGATIVKALENETGASVKMGAIVVGSKERVATISAMENPEPLFSPAQIATIRVFTRSIEVGIDRGHVAGLSNGEIVTARLLVASNQVGCLIEKGGRVVSDIITVSGVDVQILGGDLVPNCAGKDDKVIQIIGEYENVKSALFQVTGRLRKNLFTSMAFGGAGARNCSYSAIPDISPYERRGEITSSGLNHSSGISRLDQEMTETGGPNHSGLLQNVGGPISPRLQLSQVTGKGNVPDHTGSGRGLTTFGDGLGHRRIEPAVMENTTVEVVVPKPLFGSIYGEDGSNLARLKQISGAKVIVHDPCPGENEGKVTVTGTADQTLIARSLIHAFMLTVQ